MEKKSAEYKHADPSLDDVLRVSQAYVQEAKQARTERMDMNTTNYDAYHLRQDYSHKKEGQSRETLPKQMMATEQIVSFIEQGLIAVPDWYRVDLAPGVDKESVIIQPHEIQLLTDRQLDRAQFIDRLHDTLKLGLLGSLCIMKVGGKRVPSISYEAQAYEDEMGRAKTKLLKKDKSVWQLNLTAISPENYYPDPSGKNLYRMHQEYLDLHEVRALSEGDNAIYDKTIVDQIKQDYAMDWEEQIQQARREGKQLIAPNIRKKVKLQEFWGEVIHPVTGDIMHSNCVWTIADDKYVIQRPTPNPFWHKKCPIVVTPIVRVPNSVWHRALMDAPTKHNIALNELFNLMLDSGIMATFGIKQYRPDWLVDAAAFDEGFAPADSVAVNGNCPPGMKAIERVDTATMSQEAIQMYQLLNAEFNQGAMTNDLRMGTLPGRQVKATEVVEASNTLNGLIGGIAKRIDEDFITQVVELSWITTLQHMDDLSDPEVRAMLGDQRAMAISAIPKEERFAKSVQNASFKVYGVSRMVQKQNDYRKLTALLQTIGTSPVLLQEFMQRYSMPKFLEEIMRALDVNTTRLEVTPEEAQAAQGRMQQMAQLAMAQSGGANNGPMEAALGDQTQIPQASTGASDAIQSRVNNPSV